MTKSDLVVDTHLNDDNKRLPEQVDEKKSAEQVDEKKPAEQDTDSDDDEQDGDDDDDDGCSDSSSSSSIPDADIDFDLVYTRCEFVATVEGQASVTKGATLKLLDDKNPYWWLIKAVESGEVGYIPAENIEA